MMVDRRDNGGGRQLAGISRDFELDQFTSQGYQTGMTIGHNL